MALVLLAQGLRPHGIPRVGCYSFKCELFNRRSLSFVGRTSVWIADSAAPARMMLLVDEPQPLGGKWGQAHGMILRFKDPPALPFDVSIPRNELPDAEAGERYLIDFVGRTLTDVQDPSFTASILGVADHSQGTAVVFNFILRIGSRDVQVPVSWVLHADILDKTIIVDGLKSLCELQLRASTEAEVPDDRDD